MGKQNIEVEEGEGVAAEFTTDRGCLRLRLKPSLLERIHESLEDEELTISLNQELIDARYEDLFEISRIRKGLT